MGVQQNVRGPLTFSTGLFIQYAVIQSILYLPSYPRTSNYTKTKDEQGLLLNDCSNYTYNRDKDI